MKKIVSYALFLLLAGLFMHATPSHQALVASSFPQDSATKTILKGIVSSTKYQEIKHPLDSASISVMERHAPYKKLAEVQTDAKGFYEVDLSAYPVIEVTMIVQAKGHGSIAFNQTIRRKTTTIKDIRLEKDSDKY